MVKYAILAKNLNFRDMLNSKVIESFSENTAFPLCSDQQEGANLGNPRVKRVFWAKEASCLQD